MANILTKYLILAFAYLAVLYPLWVRLSNSPLVFDSTLPLNLFPYFGLAAFSMLWLHAISGAFEEWLRKYINFDHFVEITSTLILICIIAHPLLLLIGFGFNIGNIYLVYGTFYIWLAIAGWLLLITYDIGKKLKKYDFFVKNWNKILIISNIGFILTFFHSLGIGSNLQSGPLRIIWIFYGATAILAIIYTYAIKPFLIKSRNKKKPHPLTGHILFLATA